MRLRGVEKHYKTLLDLGFVPSTARSFLGGTAALVKLEHVEKLCVALNCTPNDLLEWRPDASQAAVAETHSMNNLKRADENDLAKLLNEVPSDKFEQILDLLQELKNKA